MRLETISSGTVGLISLAMSFYNARSQRDKLWNFGDRAHAWQTDQQRVERVVLLAQDVKLLVDVVLDANPSVDRRCFPVDLKQERGEQGYRPCALLIEV